VITTIVAQCVTIDYNEVVVNILLPNSSVLLSTAPAAVNSPAINKVTAPATGGPWSLVVQVLWINYPAGGTLAMSQTTITIMINGPSATSTVASITASSTKFTSSIAASSTVFSYSTLTSVKVSSSTVMPYSTVTLSKSLTSASLPLTTTSESTFALSTPNSSSNPLSNITLYSLQNPTGVVMILAVVVVLLLVGVFALKRRGR
jgi:hypothetical protein